MKRIVLTALLLIVAAGCTKEPNATATTGPTDGTHFVQPNATAASSPAPAAEREPTIPTAEIITAARVKGPIAVNFRRAGMLDHNFVGVVTVFPRSVTEVPYPERKRYEVSGQTTLATIVSGDAIYNYLNAQVDKMPDAGRNGMVKAATSAALQFRQDEIRAWPLTSSESYAETFIIEWCGDSWQVIEVQCGRSPQSQLDVSQWDHPRPAEVPTENVREASYAAPPSDNRAGDVTSQSSAKIDEEPIDETIAQGATVASSTAPKYPPTESRMGVGGVVELHISLDGEGNVLDVAVATSSGNANLDRAAQNAARRWRFHPAKNAKGQGVRSRIMVPVTFTPPT